MSKVELINLYKIFKDGDSWCAVGPGFIDLQESLAGFGDTKAEALAELEKAESKAERRRRENIRRWKCNNCEKEFSRATKEDKAPCPFCKSGNQYTYEVFS